MIDLLKWFIELPTEYSVTSLGMLGLLFMLLNDYSENSRNVICRQILSLLCYMVIATTILTSAILLNKINPSCFHVGFVLAIYIVFISLTIICIFINLISIILGVIKKGKYVEGDEQNHEKEQS